MTRTRRSDSAASTTEYLVIIAAVSLALIGSVTLFGRRVARFWEADLATTDQGSPVDSTVSFPTTPLDRMKAGDTPPLGTLPETATPDDHLRYYDSLLDCAAGRIADLSRDDLSYDELPPAIDLTGNLDEATAAALRRTRASGAGRQEHGATIVKDPQGNLHVVNPGAGVTNGFTRNPAVPEEQAGGRVVGTFHTHPDGSPFSEADTASTVTGKLPFKLLQNTDEQWLLVRTSDTPDQSPTSGLSLDDAVKHALGEAGRSFDDPDAAGFVSARNRQATEDALARVAQEFRLGLYRGQPGFSLGRVPVPDAPARASSSSVPNIPDDIPESGEAPR